MIQYNEYYPFGLQTSTSWTRDNTKDNNYLYNAANELNKTSGWYEMFYRGYDPAIGRMLQVDPYAPMYASTTTYNYALNNPVMMNDPTGGYTTSYDADGISDVAQQRMYKLYSNHDVGIHAGWSESYNISEGGGQVLSAEYAAAVMRDAMYDFKYGSGAVSIDPSYFGTILDAASRGKVSIDGMLMTIGMEKIAFNAEITANERSMYNVSSTVEFAGGNIFRPIRKSLASMIRISPNQSVDYHGSSWINASAAILNEFAIATSIGVHGPKPVGVSRVDWASRVKVGTATGNYLSYMSLMLTAYDMYSNGVNTSNFLDGAFGIIGFCGVPGAVISGVYFGANLITVGATGKTIGQHIDENFYILPGALAAPVMIIPKKF